MFKDKIIRKKAELYELEKFQEVVEKLRESESIVCHGHIYESGCGADLPLNELTCIQTYGYENPFIRTGGDTFTSSDANFICPRCGIRNSPRIMGDWDTLGDYQFSLIKKKFKAHVNEFPDY